MLKGVSLQAASIAVSATSLSGGTSTRVLFDDGGVVGESSLFTFTKATGALSVTGTISCSGAIQSTGGNIAGNGLIINRGGVNYAALLDDGDGNIRLYNGAANNFGLLKFGGTTSSFPALKRSTTTIQVRLADDSAYADLYTKGVYTNEAAALVRSNVALTSLAGANTATLTNSPNTGNPSDWIPIYVNGNRYAIPIWNVP